MREEYDRGSELRCTAADLHTAARRSSSSGTRGGDADEPERARAAGLVERERVPSVSTVGSTSKMTSFYICLAPTPHPRPHRWLPSTLTDHVILLVDRLPRTECLSTLSRASRPGVALRSTRASDALLCSSAHDPLTLSLSTRSMLARLWMARRTPRPGESWRCGTSGTPPEAAWNMPALLVLQLMRQRHDDERCVTDGWRRKNRANDVGEVGRRRVDIVGVGSRAFSSR